MTPRTMMICPLLLLLSLWTSCAHASLSGLKDSTIEKLNGGKSLTRKETQEVEGYERKKYIGLRQAGWDEVSNTQEAAALRKYRLRKRKSIGLFRRQKASLSQVFYPGSVPVEYHHDDQTAVVGNLIQSRRNLASFGASKHPAFATLPNNNTRSSNNHPTIPLGAKLLEGYSKATFQSLLDFAIGTDVGCTPILTTQLSAKQLELLRFMIQNKYRMHLSLDGLPVLLRTKEFKYYAIKGVPIGFESPEGQMFLYNHWKFIVTYHQDESSFQGVRITGFDVHPVTISHRQEVSSGNNNNNDISTCSGKSPENIPETYLSLAPSTSITFSYEVQWVRSDLPWEDRWDVYFLGLPDDAIHYFSILNSVICVLFLAGLVAAALVRVFRKELLGGAKKENGWKHVKGQVFRPPKSPMMLSVLVGNGLHILISAIITMILNLFHVINTMKTGEPLTGMLFVYAATGTIAVYTSARLYKLCEGENFKLNGILTSATLSGSMLVIYCFFNMIANAIGSSSSDALSVVALIGLWICQVGLSYWGSLLGEKAPCIQVPTETTEKVRPIPVTRWIKLKRWAGFASGMICFGVIDVELHFLMTAIWLKETYLGFGYLLTVTLLATIVCAESAICLCYFQLHSEDHEWWWMAFSNGASVGGYMIFYTFLDRFKRIELVGMYSNSAYFTCMFLATISIGMVCGSIGFLSCLWFTRTIYSANIDDESDDDDEEIAPLAKDVPASVEASDLQ